MMNTHKIHVMLIAISAVVFVLAHISVLTPVMAQAPVAQKLDSQTLEEMRHTMRRAIYPYGSFEEPDPQDPEVFIERLVPSDGRIWNHGMPIQLLDVVSIAPAHFAPAIRERLMRLPPTFEEYSLHHPEWSISGKAHQLPMGDEIVETTSPSPAGNLLVIASHLDRATAEPILRDFYDRMSALQQEAEAQVTAFEKEPNTDPKELEYLRSLSLKFAGWRVRAIGAAHRLKLPMFIEEGIETLERLDDIANVMGQNGLVAYLAEFADERPDLYRRMKAIADRFESVRTSHERTLTFMVKKELERIDARD